ncbi:MAG: polysaccharide biosynthesis/export family protein [Planctomycetota bacterium]|nr:polysaccharide biosynthesis/export family protein [Planctomycetota bacterium]
MKSVLQLLIGALLSLFCVAVASAATTMPSPADSMAPPVAGPDYKVGPGDLLSVSIYDLQREGSGPAVRMVRVGNNGMIKVPYLPQIKAQGLDEEGLEREISKAYGDANIIKNACIDISVLDIAANNPDKARQAVEQFILPEITTGEESLGDLLNLVHNHNPAFNFIVVRGSGVASDYPTIPGLNLKNISIGQFVGFVRDNYDTITVTAEVGGNGQSVLYVFNVVGPVTKENNAKSSVYIYRLTGLVDSLGGTQKNLNDVLSLVQKALETSEDTKGCSLQVHAETETLLFRGSVSQIRIVATALAALKDDQSPRVSGGKIVTTRPQE